MNSSKIESTTNNPPPTDLKFCNLRAVRTIFLFCCLFLYIASTAVSHSLRILKACLHSFFLLMFHLQLVYLQRKYPFTNQKVKFYSGKSHLGHLEYIGFVQCSSLKKVWPLVWYLLSHWLHRIILSPFFMDSAVLHIWFECTSFSFEITPIALVTLLFGTTGSSGRVCS